jgi:hypothetical protein
VSEAIETQLKRVLAARPSAEVRRRIKVLLDRNVNHRLYPTPARLRHERAIEVLEQIGDGPARQLLTLLAQGAPAASLTLDARGALERLAANPSPMP